MNGFSQSFRADIENINGKEHLGINALPNTLVTITFADNTTRNFRMGNTGVLEFDLDIHVTQVQFNFDYTDEQTTEEISVKNKKNLYLVDFIQTKS